MGDQYPDKIRLGSVYGVSMADNIGIDQVTGKETPPEVPTQSINLNDVPERFRNSVKEPSKEVTTRVIETSRVTDNTVRKENPNQTTNIVFENQSNSQN